MILTFKVKHDRDFSKELAKAKQIADFALQTRTQSSKDVKQFGLKSAVANQILREYSRNKKLKEVKNVNLIVPNQSIKVNQKKKVIEIPCLKFAFSYRFRNDFTRINQIEIDKEWIFVSVTIPEKKELKVKNWIGVDRNTTGHIAVLANPKTGEVIKLGKEALHIHNKYRNIRRELQSNGKYGKAKSIKNRESRIVRNLNHQVSRAIISLAKKSKCGIKLENLKGIRNNRRHTRSFNYSLHSWSFYQLEQFIKYKAKLEGIPIIYVEAKNTSKECSRCGSIGVRQEKEFECPGCGHVDHADANAGFNIAKRIPIGAGIGRLRADRDVRKGNTDIPRGATL